MEDILSTDPIEEADAAIVSGDPALLELNGYGSYIPGLEDLDIRGCRRRNLEFTSDDGSREFHETQRRLRAYAATYNQRIRPHVLCES